MITFPLRSISCPFCSVLSVLITTGTRFVPVTQFITTLLANSRLPVSAVMKEVGRLEVLAVLWKYRERVTLLFCIKEERGFGEVFSTDGKNKEKKGRGLRGLLFAVRYLHGNRTGTVCPKSECGRGCERRGKQKEGVMGKMTTPKNKEVDVWKRRKLDGDLKKPQLLVSSKPNCQ